MIGHEGGYVNHPSDPGGETKYGITKRTYPHLNIRDITLDQAKRIYRKDFWEASGASRYPWPMSYYIFDVAVNSGVGRAKEFLRGNPTPGQFLAKRLRFMTNLGIWKDFGRGWARRIAALVEMLPAPTGEAVAQTPRLIFLNGQPFTFKKASQVEDKWYITTEG